MVLFHVEFFPCKKLKLAYSRQNPKDFLQINYVSAVFNEFS
jgi:hypothetical protein